MSLLAIDADDTLWENHGHFLAAHQRFEDLLEARGHDLAAGRAFLRQHEAQRIARTGYGSRPFVQSLEATVSAFEGHPLPEELREELAAIGEAIFHHPILPFPGVADTLAALATRHRLWLVTKGAQDEQEGKVARSGLAEHFDRVVVLAEKTEAAYRGLLPEMAEGLEDAQPWMVGNSPRSDIVPAQAAGFRTVHIPHRSLWEHEAAPLPVPPDLTLLRFSDLLDHF